MKLEDSQATQQPSEQEIAQFAAPARAMLAAELDADGQWEAAHAVRVGQAHLHRSATRAIARTLYEVAALKRRLNEQSGNSGQLQTGSTEGLTKRLRKSSAVLLDTSSMATQFPAWLRGELETAASLHDECVAVLVARQPAAAESLYELARGAQRAFCGSDVMDARAVLAVATSWRCAASASPPAGRKTLIRCAEELEAAVAARPERTA